MTTPTGPTPIWVVMPVLTAPELTEAAISDVLAQSVPMRLLLVNQGVDDAFRLRLERIAEGHADRVFVWSHQPPLPSLAATWNRALDCVWAAGGEVALVVNNDVRLSRGTVWGLQTILERTGALFVTAVGVTAEQFDPAAEVCLTTYFDSATDRETTAAMKGGPDFSCFLISAACHRRFRFDEGFIPAFAEDCSYHRELLLAGEGSRIFSVNLPYLHYASSTLKSLPPAEADQIRRQIEQGSRQHYLRCWGGGVNHERYVVKGDPTSARDGVTNPELQAWVQGGGDMRDLINGWR